jgi:hypothetical protein
MSEVSFFLSERDVSNVLMLIQLTV